jgi:hypothetical protein
VSAAVLAADAALATARFRWRLRSGEWTMTYGHVDHYPDEKGPD